MTAKLGKFYYENILASQNITARNNVVWAGDTSKLELYRGQTVHIFVCIDIHTNLIVASFISKNKIKSSTIVKNLESAIKSRIKTLNDEKLIIHVDRGTEFSSKVFNNFVKKYSELFVPSMSRLNTPTDNAVMERFWRTLLKNHKIFNTTIEEELTNSLARIPNFSGYRACLNKYVKSLNSTPSKKASYGAQKLDNDVSTAALLMHQPNFLKAQSERVSEDLRLPDVENYKA
jgi:transposase InsO family protein